MAEKTIQQLHADIREAAFTKAEELGRQLNVLVHPLVFQDDDDEKKLVVGFMKEPNRTVKLAVMDKSITYPVTAAEQMYEVILLREHSDTRLYSEDPKNDVYYMGGVMAAYELVKRKVNLIGKKK